MTRDSYDSDFYPLQDETYELIGIAMEVHRILGTGMLEVVYKDAIEYELRKRGIAYQREKEFLVAYKDVILPHVFYADFQVYNKIILEVKCKSWIVEEHYAQVLNYLAISGMKVGLIVNFHAKSLQYKRLVK